MQDRKNQNALTTIILVVLVLSGTFMFIRSTVNRTVAEPEVAFTDTLLTVSGMYGHTYSLESIQSVDLVEGTPPLGRKINGAGLSSRQVYRGLYQVEGLGECRVFLFGDRGPYIQMHAEEEILLIMFSQSQDTLDLYDAIMNHKP